MNQSNSKWRHYFLDNGSLSTPILIFFAFCLLLLRAWPRLLYPEVWIEDGTENVYGLIHFGPLDIFRPVGGYLVFISKLISLLSLAISFEYYPLISTVVAWFFTIFVFVIIAKAPIKLKGQFFLAAFCMLIPSDPECFGLPMYTYWWSALLLFIMVFWHPGQWIYLRMMMLGLCSLSSPVCLVTLPLFWIRAFYFRTYRSEFYIAILASICAGIQIYVMNGYSKPAEFHFELSYLVIKVFLGNYVVGNIYPNITWMMGAMLFGFISIGVWRSKSKQLYVLCYLLFVSILMSIYRVDISILNPVNAGPRYFFFPFVLLSWVLIQLIFDSRLLFFKIGATFFLCTSLVNATPHLIRKHDRLDWGKRAMKCLHEEKTSFLVHMAGSADHAWSFTLTGEECAKIMNRNLF
jgi:hypothetical protein